MPTRTSGKCFDNPAAQILHKYLTFVLLLFVGALGWWFNNLEGRMLRAEAATRIIEVTLARAEEQNKAVLFQLQRIESRITWIQERAYLKRKAELEVEESQQ